VVAVGKKRKARSLCCQCPAEQVFPTSGHHASGHRCPCRYRHPRRRGTCGNRAENVNYVHRYFLRASSVHFCRKKRAAAQPITLAYQNN
jgi:hypothetical protein